MAAAKEKETPPDRITPSELIDSISKLTTEAEQKPTSARNTNEQSLSTKDEDVVSPDVQQDTAPANPSTSVTGQPGNPDASSEHTIVRPANIYAPQAQATYYGGYNNVSGDWDEYFPYVNHEGLELGSPSIYNENPSLLFHTRYGYNPQVPYGPYSPVTTPLPSSRGESQMYSPQQYQMTASYYHQTLPPNLSFLNSPTPVPQTDIPVPVGMEQQGAFLSDTSNSNNMPFGPRPNHPSHGAFGRSNFSGNSGNHDFYDSRQGFDGFGSGGPWPDWSKSSDGQKSLMPQYSPLASPQPINAHGSFGYNVNPFASGMATQQQSPLYPFGSSFNSFDRGYSYGGHYNNDSIFNANMGRNGQGWIMNDKGRRRGKGEASLYRPNGTPDFLNEQSKGPRATRSKNSIMQQNSSVESKNRNPAAVAPEIYNKSDFIIEYKDAKFFIIKSYSEDNVHKSIKYGVWASTPGGNKKLDAAYHEAKERGGACPVFLFFSVNTSAQFCGVAEMIGAVDFDKSVDYWQQDKFDGQLPVKWHIVKDVPNNQFRHIILENNDNKPVTNSRDTQEVKLEQGLEMLGIFKEHEYETSILDDFDFYEERQKAMQERKALQKQQQSNSMASYLPTSIAEHRYPLSFPGNHTDQVSKNYAHVIQLDEVNKENVAATGKGSITVAEAKAGDKTEIMIADSS